MPNLPRWLILCGWVEAELATWTDAAKNTCLYFGSLQRAGQVGVDSFFQPALKLTWWSPPWTDFLGVGIGPSWLTSSTRRNGCQTWYQHGLKQNGTNYPTRMLCSKCFVTRGVYRHILFKSTLCGGSIRENLWTLSWQKCPTKHSTREKGYILLPKQLLSYQLLLHSWGQGSDGAHNMVK